MDVITLINSQSKEHRQFNWKFENEELTLTEFIQDGKTNNFLLGNNKIVFKLKITK
ncbi:hypothetical protein [Winogradskyella sp.]|uniref:hypothetical protein n=1 Tax=Winogradskyella sp. TaxID=1883156 RepID=UPI0026246437|nr:hypothetical protein [Winogradskyella sp.]